MGLLENRMPVLSFPKFAHPKSLAAPNAEEYFLMDEPARKKNILGINTKVVVYNFNYCPECTVQRKPMGMLPVRS